MWYGAHAASPGYDGRVSLCYACSDDGIHWERQDFDFVQLSEEEGGVPNNIIGTEPFVQTTFIDPDAESPDERIVLLRGGAS